MKGKKPASASSGQAANCSWLESLSLFMLALHWVFPFWFPNSPLIMPGNQNCLVFGCHNTHGGAKYNAQATHFYRFPSKTQDEERKHVWERFCKQVKKDGSEWKATPNSRICSQHFLNNQAVNNKLHPSYYPTIYPDNSTTRPHRVLLPPPRPVSPSRFNRYVLI